MNEQLTKRSNRWFLLAAITLFLGIIGTYANHFDNDFHFDDQHTIVDNVYIHSLKNTGKFFTDVETRSTLPANRMYRPLLTLSYAVDYWMGGGLKPFYFHLTSFGGFLLQLAAMYFFFLHIFNLSWDHRWNRFFALFAVGWYGLHTTSAETINYISARSSSFSTLCVILAFLAYIFFKRYWKFLWIIPIAMGMLIKPTTTMFAALLIGYIFCFESQVSFRQFIRGRPLYRNGLLQGTVACLICGGLFYLVMYMTPKTWSPGGASRLQYLITQPWVILHYFRIFFVPTGVNADTDWGLITSLTDYRFIVGSIFIVVLSITTLLMLKKRSYRPIGYGLFWFLMALLPSSSLVPLAEVLNYHRIFFPYVGLVMAVVCVIALLIMRYESLWTKAVYKGALITALLCIIAANAYGTYRRNQVWDSPETLWYDVTLKSPKNGRGLMNYGLSQMVKGDYKTAEMYFKRALQYTPVYSYLHMNLGTLYYFLKKPEEAERHFRNAIVYDRANPKAYFLYGSWLVTQKRYDEAEVYLRDALRLNFSSMPARDSLMYMYQEQGEWDKLQALATETLKIDPGDETAQTYLKIAEQRLTLSTTPLESLVSEQSEDAYIELSLILYNAGLYQRSIEAAEKALTINPKSALAFNNICAAHNALNEWDQAVAACKKALRLAPDFAHAKNNLSIASQHLTP